MGCHEVALINPPPATNSRRIVARIRVDLQEMRWQIQATSNLQNPSINRLSLARAPKSSLASTQRAVQSKTCMKVIAYLQAEGRHQRKNLTMNPRSRKSQKTTGWSRSVAARTILMSSSSDTCRMKRAKQLQARAIKLKKKKMKCSPRRKNFWVRAKSRNLTRKQKWWKSLWVTLTAPRISMGSNWHQNNRFLTAWSDLGTQDRKSTLWRSESTSSATWRIFWKFWRSRKLLPSFSPFLMSMRQKSRNTWR